MSHYSVAVIVNKLDENEVRKMLVPYQENNEENPNSKWDWYDIGGRCNNRLLIKENIPIEEVGGLYWGMAKPKAKPAPIGYKWVNACKIKDLEIEKMMEGKYEKEKRFWELKVEGKEPQNEEEKETLEWDYYKKRILYREIFIKRRICKMEINVCYICNGRRKRLA